MGRKPSLHFAGARRAETGMISNVNQGLLLRFDARMEFEGHLVTTLRDVNITWMELVDSYSRKTVDVDNFLQLVGIQGTVSVPTIGKWKKDLHFLNKISVSVGEAGTELRRLLGRGELAL